MSDSFFTTAFNAALVIIGATWVHRTRQSGKGSASTCANIHIYPSRAVATLYKLDTGNRMVDRCRYYLEELIVALRLQRKASSRTDANAWADQIEQQRICRISLAWASQSWTLRPRTSASLHLVLSVASSCWTIYLRTAQDSNVGRLLLIGMAKARINAEPTKKKHAPWYY